MGELVEFIAKSLVENPEDVEVNEIEGTQSVIIELKVHPDDMGKVIGMVSKKVAGQAEGARISTLVKQLLG